MTGSDRVVRLDDYRPHAWWRMRCLDCGARWVAVVSVGTTKPLECLECHRMAGLPEEPDPAA